MTKNSVSSQPQSISDIARVALHRLTELELPPTPENYLRYYYEVSGLVPPTPEPNNTNTELFADLIRTLIEKLSESTGSLASNIDDHNREIKQSLDTLAHSQEKHQIMSLLGTIITTASEMHG